MQMAAIEERLAALEAKVRELTDREELRDLRYRYHEYVNEGKFAEIPGLFTENGELDFAHMGSAKGREKVAGFFAGLDRSSEKTSGQPAPGISFVKQFIHNHVIKFHGDHAHGFSYLEAKPVYNGEAFLVAARYDDEYVKENGAWKFSKMTLTPYFMVPLKEGWAQKDRIKMGR
jgi:hypothetical protein